MVGKFGVPFGLPTGFTSFSGRQDAPRRFYDSGFHGRQFRLMVRCLLRMGAILTCSFAAMKEMMEVSHQDTNHFRSHRQVLLM